MNRIGPVAITGMGCFTAAGTTVEANLGSMIRGERSVAPPRGFCTDHPGSFPVFEILREYEDNAERDSNKLTRTAHLAIDAARSGIENSGWTPEELAGLRVGVITGTTVGATYNHESSYRQYRAGDKPGSFAMDRILRSNPSDAVARELALTGPRQTVLNACSSGADAIGLGAAWIRSGYCDLVLAGGADELCRFTYTGFISLMVTSEEPCKPFDAQRKGLNLGEGAAFLVLESDKLLEKRGATVRGHVHGYGSAGDAHHLTAPHPDGNGLRGAISAAMGQWGGEAKDLCLVNAHGTSTQENDKVEGKVVADMLPGVPFHSTKGYTGHTLGAAGAVEAALTIGMLERGRAPGCAGFSKEDPAIAASPFAEPLALDGNCAISTSLAFGGCNSALILGVEK